MARRYDGLLVDIDGTLVDSNDAHASAWVAAFAMHGHTLPFSRIRPLIGMGGDKLLDRLIGVSDESPEGRAIGDARKQIFARDYLPRLRPTDGAERLLVWLRAAQLRVVVATSARKEEVRGLLAVCGGLHLLDDATSSDDAEESKPDPDIIVAALARCGLPANRVAMLGDTPYDIDAARRAGVDTVALRCGGWADLHLRDAIAIYDHPADLLNRIQESPFSR